MSQLPIFELFIIVGNLKPKLKPNLYLLNCHPGGEPRRVCQEPGLFLRLLAGHHARLRGGSAARRLRPDQGVVRQPQGGDKFSWWEIDVVEEDKERSCVDNGT